MIPTPPPGAPSRRPRIPLWAIVALGLGAPVAGTIGYVAARPEPVTVEAPPAPVVVEAPIVTPEVTTPPVDVLPPAVLPEPVASEPAASEAPDPRACDADFARLCAGCVTKMDKVESVKAARTDADPANDPSAACAASLDYGDALNQAVKDECAPYWSVCRGVKPNPTSGTSEGANTAEPCYDALRAAVGTAIPAGSSCDLALAAHTARQEEVTSAPRGGR